LRLSPSFEEMEVYSATRGEGVGFKFEEANQPLMRSVWVEGFDVGIDYDSNVTQKGIYSDASYHVLDGGTRVLLNDTGILVSDNEGGFEMFGGEISVGPTEPTIGIYVRGGWQTRIVGTKIEGHWNNGAGRGTGLRIAGSGVQVAASQFESLHEGIRLTSTARRNNVAGVYISNGGDGMIGITAEAGSRQNLLPPETVGFSRTSNDPIRNAGTNLSVASTNTAP
jgi:hypothetical protein